MCHYVSSIISIDFPFFRIVPPAWVAGLPGLAGLAGLVGLAGFAGLLGLGGLAGLAGLAELAGFRGYGPTARYVYVSIILISGI